MKRNKQVHQRNEVYRFTETLYIADPLFHLFHVIDSSALL